MGVGREVSAILNVGFSAAGVAGGVWWLGTKSYVGWSVEKVRLAASLLCFDTSLKTQLRTWLEGLQSGCSLRAPSRMC